MPQFIAQQFELINETHEMLGKSKGRNANHCVKEVAFVVVVYFDQRNGAFVVAKTDIKLDRLAPSLGNLFQCIFYISKISA